MKMSFNLNLLKKHYKKLSLLMFLEFLLWILIAIILVFSSAKLAENYEILNKVGSFNSEQFLDGEDEDLIKLQEKLNLMNNSLDNILKLYGLTILFLFLVIGAFRSIQWMVTYNIIEKKKFSWKYLLKFYLLILFWIIVLGVFLYVINFIFNNPYLILVVVFLFYVFSSISIVFLLKENKFLNCIKKSFKLFFSKRILIFIIIILVFLVSIFVLNLLANIGIIISIIGLIWILFLIAYSKLFILLNL